MFVAWEEISKEFLVEIVHTTIHIQNRLPERPWNGKIQNKALQGRKPATEQLRLLELFVVFLFQKLKETSWIKKPQFGALTTLLKGIKSSTIKQKSWLW